MKLAKFFILFITLFFSCEPAFPCTEFRLQAKDNTVLISRTMEFGVDMHSNLRTSTRNRKFNLTTSNGKQSLSWNAKYGFVFFDGFDVDVALDGLNEAGLSFGALYLPGLAQYQTAPKNRQKDTLSYVQLGNWILSNFATVNEVKSALKTIYVVGDRLAEFPDIIFPLHFSVYDASGKGVVIEYINGQLNMHDNNIGVLTNSPSYDWHLSNLNNYTHLNPFNPPAISLNGVTFAPRGQGFGMVDLPGDVSPPSRFVKMATLLRVAMPPNDALSGVNLAAHIINNVDIPLGFVRSQENPRSSDISMETTQWTAFKDLTHKILYFRTYENLQLRAINLDKIDFSENAKRLKMPLTSKQVVDEITSRFLNSPDLKSSNVLYVKMTPAEGQTAQGNLKFTQMGNTLIIQGEASGLTPGAHGFHIHEHATCEDCHEGFKEAGSHYNPTHVKHGSLESGHAGDLGNIVADKNGNAKIFIKTQKINIKNDGNEFSILNRTAMIHAQEDDLKTDPAGNSGARILCGVLSSVD